MSDLRIALDLEGVLADTHIPVVERSDILNDEHFEGWDFEGDELDHFLEILEDIWREHTMEIPPSEPDLGEKINKLREIAEVHLVTNTPGDREHVEEWLARRGIDVDEIHIPGPGTHKEDLDYDIYIDDNPYLLGKVDVLYFVTTSWNDHLDGDNFGKFGDEDGVTYYDIDENLNNSIKNSDHSNPSVVRVNSVQQAYLDLITRLKTGGV